MVVVLNSSEFILSPITHFLCKYLRNFLSHKKILNFKLIIIEIGLTNLNSKSYKILKPLLEYFFKISYMIIPIISNHLP